MKIRAFCKALTVVAILAMVLSFASCGLFGGGALKLDSFTVDRSSVKTNYLIGEEIDFSGIKATVKYNDESLNKVYTYDELTITYDKDITATVGDKEVTVSFDDPHLNVKQETKVAIKVTSEPIVDDTTDPQIVVQFEKPVDLNSFDSDNENAGKSKPTDESFSGEFAVGNQTYVIGNENAFKLNPMFAVLNDDGYPMELEKFFATVEISVEKDGEYVALTKAAGEGNLVSYYDGETLIATVDIYEGTYQFSADANGCKVKISVLPSEEHYIYDGHAVVLEAEIITAYNIYEAWELALIDNDSSEERAYELDDTNIWDDFKNLKGIKDLDVSGIVIHTDLTVTAADVPEKFLLTCDKDIIYTNNVTGETKTISAGTKYLKDWAEIYRRVLSPDETFVIEGNFFTIDVSTFPIIPSPAVFGLEGEGDDYGSDFSNATFFKFITDDATSEENFSDVEINNVNLIGNASRDNYVDADGNLASAGGLIFLKIFRDTSLTCNNIIGNSFFITYFPDERAILTANDVKCYNSYQNAVFVWGDSSAIFNNSYLNGAGGPVVICASPEIGSTGVYQDPTFISNGTVIETHLSGEEIWFTAVNATTMVSQIKGLNTALQLPQLGSFVDDSGKMNIEGLIMAEGSDAEAIIKAYNAQGKITIDGEGMDRIQSETNINLAYIIGITEGALAYGQMPPFFTVTEIVKNEDGTVKIDEETGKKIVNVYTVYFNGTTLVDLAGNALGTHESHAALVAAFQNSDKVTLTQGGLSVVFELYH